MSNELEELQNIKRLIFSQILVNSVLFATQCFGLNQYEESFEHIQRVETVED